jgi:hypothetical protein
LKDVSGSEVHVVPITPFDWTLGHLRGYGQLAFEVASTVDSALLESDSKKAVLVGYSTGGIWPGRTSAEIPPTVGVATRVTAA